MRVSKPPSERRAELVAAARLLFDQKGLDNTRVSDIVKHVGVAQGVFYYYFPSKAAMVAEVVRQVNCETQAKANAILANAATTFAQKLAEYIELYIGLVDQFLGDDEPNMSSLQTPRQDGLTAQSLEALTGCLDKLVDMGVAQGEICAAFPRQAGRVALYGLRSLAYESLPSRRQVYAITEQSLGMAKGSLTGLLV